MNVRSLSLRGIVAGATALVSLAVGTVSGCSGDEKACSIGETECLGKEVARVCAPTGVDKTPTWIPFECGEGNQCVDPGDSDGGGEGEAACVGTCTPGAVECVTGEVSRYCLDGRAWQLDACSVGERCQPNVGCGVDQDGGVRACEPGRRSCAAPDVAKVCDTDGSSWIPLPCASYETCNSATGACEPDPESSCDDVGFGGGVCLDRTTAVRCLARTGGFELDECPTGTYCSGGRCIGDVCAIGSVCVGLNQIRTCIDGTNQSDRQCESNEICVQNEDEASCVVPDCIPDDKVCGDPNDPAVDPTTGYSVCRASGDTNSGIPVWQFTACEGQLECSPTLVDTSNPCRKECTPGEQMCASDGAAGIHQGWVECDADGNWGPIQDCNPNPTASLELICANKPFQPAGTVNQVACAEPVCASVWNNLLDVSNTGGVPLQQGTCEGTQIRECDNDTGALAASATACATGSCLVASTIPADDGLLRGECRDFTACEDGESVCVTTGILSTSTPFFRTCQGGVLDSELQRCDADETCFDSFTVDGMRIASCGGECGEGWTRCGAGGIETCGADGNWGAAAACSAGHCENVGSNQAKCVLDCIPGNLGCDGTTIVTSDGYHTGTTHAVTCKPDGSWPSIFDAGDDSYVTLCDQVGGEACRISSRGEGIGCVQCVGPNVLGGNVDGVTETRCDPSTPANLQQCAADNTWGPSSTCGAGTACTGPQQVCLNCYGENNVWGPCTETNMNNANEEVCTSCAMTSIIATVTPNCSEAVFPSVAVGDSGSQQLTCASEGFGPPSAWGGVADCCGAPVLGGFNHRLGTTNTCETRGFGAPSAWGGQPDCCDDYRDYTGSGLAYCAPSFIGP